MATPTYELIETTTLSSSASSVTFSSITQSFRDLVLVVRGNSTSNSFAYPLLRLNNSSSTYYYVEGFGQSSSTYSGSSTASGIPSINGGEEPMKTSRQALIIYEIFDYSQTDKEKSVLTRTNTDDGSLVGYSASKWASTSAVSSLVLYPTNGGTPGASLASGLTMSLYGIAG